MTTIRVLISGTGSMGRQVGLAVHEAEDTEPVGYIDALATVDAIDGVPVYRDAATACAEAGANAIVDFTNAAFTPTLARAAVERRIPLVIGTTGLDPTFMNWLEGECRGGGIGAVVAPNFALGAVLMMHFARQAAKHFNSAEIIELHHNRKADAPSGTAKLTAEQMVEARGEPFGHADTEHEIVPGTRGGEIGGIALHSVRLPGLVAHQEILLGAQGQTLTLRHDSTGRDSFMPGVLLAVRRVQELDHLVIGLESLLGLDAG